MIMIFPVNALIERHKSDHVAARARWKARWECGTRQLGQNHCILRFVAEPWAIETQIRTEKKERKRIQERCRYHYCRALPSFAQLEAIHPVGVNNMSQERDAPIPFVTHTHTHFCIWVWALQVMLPAYIARHLTAVCRGTLSYSQSSCVCRRWLANLVLTGNRKEKRKKEKTDMWVAHRKLPPHTWWKVWKSVTLPENGLRALYIRRCMEWLYDIYHCTRTFLVRCVCCGAMVAISVIVRRPRHWFMLSSEEKIVNF